MAHGGVAVDGDIQLHFAQQVVVELQPLPDGFARRLTGQHAACLAEIVRLQVGRNLADRLDHTLAEHGQVVRSAASPPRPRMAAATRSISSRSGRSWRVR